jgi:hypothetical protein
VTLDDRIDFSRFLKNPQQLGAWCLRANLTEEARTSFQKLLNLEPLLFRYGTKYRYRFGYDAYPMDIPPSVLVRMFAYLRACLPKIVQSDLPDLAPSEATEIRSRRNWTRTRYSHDLRELATPPPRLSPKKRTTLNAAAKLFHAHFSHFRCSLVPENPGKIDFSNSYSHQYFQASQEPQGMLKAFSIHEQTILKLRELLEAVTDANLEIEVIRVFSPETLLMELYVPIMRLLRPANLISDVSTIKHLEQVLDEIRDERFVHAIRATGIAAEELMVEIYETYVHEKAPSSALGELLVSFQSRLKEIVHGRATVSAPPLKDSKRAIGKFIESEKQKPDPDKSAINLAEVLQKTLMPLVEDLSRRAAEFSRSNQKDVKVSVFPSYVQRCVSELVHLRNRVSHRVERIASSVTNVGYVEASLALRAYVVLASWWHQERGQINYKQSRKKIVEDTAARSAVDGLGGDESLATTATQK